jgi:Protein of unknown function (DUF541)
VLRGLTRLLSVGVVVLLLATPAMAAATSEVTATGTGQTRVLPKNRHSNSSIRAAYDAARKASIKGALREAREFALQYAHAVGLKLGSVESVSDQQSNGYYGPGSFFGPFGPEQFCGTLRQPVFKRVNGRRKVVGTKKVHRCIVPQFAFTSLTVTYSAT